MKKPQIITINGQVVLGSIATTDAGTIISDSFSIGQTNQVNKYDLADYIEAANIGKLDKPITVTGSGAMFSVRDLDDDLELEFQILTMKYQQAEKQALRRHPAKGRRLYLYLADTGNPLHARPSRHLRNRG